MKIMSQKSAQLEPSCCMRTDGERHRQAKRETVFANAPVNQMSGLFIQSLVLQLLAFILT